jgi:hypothetical protein
MAQPNYPPYQPEPYAPPYEQSVSEAIQYDPTQPQIEPNYYGQMLTHGTGGMGPNGARPVQEVSYPNSYYQPSVYTGSLGVSNKLATELELGGNSALLEPKEAKETEKKEDMAFYSNNQGFNQLLGLAPQPDEESEGIEPKGKSGMEFPESAAKPFSNF